MPDGLNFVNCFNARGEKRSGVAFYNSIGEQNVGQQPQDFEYTDTNGLTTWESSNVKSVTFKNSGVTLQYNIELDAQSKNVNDVVGWANNGSQEFQVHKGENKKIFTNFDGFDCSNVYYAVATLEG